MAQCVQPTSGQLQKASRLQRTLTCSYSRVRRQQAAAGWRGLLLLKQRRNAEKLRPNTHTKTSQQKPQSFSHPSASLSEVVSASGRDLI